MSEQVTVKFFAGVRETTGDAVTTAGIGDHDTVNDVLRRLSDVYGPRFRALTLSPEGLGDGVIVMVNGQNVRLGNAGDTLLHDGDEVAVFSLIAGG